MTRRFQFSLRTLLVATFGAGCFFGGTAAGRRYYEIEHNEGLQELRIRRAYLADLSQKVCERQMQLDAERDFAKNRKYRYGGGRSWVEFAGVRVEALDDRKIKVHDPAPTYDH